jgi:hypothetical protein
MENRQRPRGTPVQARHGFRAPFRSLWLVDGPVALASCLPSRKAETNICLARSIETTTYRLVSEQCRDCLAKSDRMLFDYSVLKGVALVVACSQEDVSTVFFHRNGL